MRGLPTCADPYTSRMGRVDVDDVVGVGSRRVYKSGKDVEQTDDGASRKDWKHGAGRRRSIGPTRRQIAAPQDRRRVKDCSKVDWSAFTEQEGATATGETRGNEVQRAIAGDSLRCQAGRFAAFAPKPSQTLCRTADAARIVEAHCSFDNLTPRVPDRRSAPKSRSPLHDRLPPSTRQPRKRG